MKEQKKIQILSQENSSEREKGIRLNKYLSDAGVCSRRQADQWILDGRVKVDGIVATQGMRIKDGQIVIVDGKQVKQEEKLVCIAFHKPRGIVCTAEKREKNNVIDYLQYPMRIYPIGRLDKDSEGLLLLTNHGALANRICKARYYHEKEYIVTVNRKITDDFVKKMEKGVPILNTITRPCTVMKENDITFRIILTQGLNRQIRRMCEYLGYRVLTLKRVRIMNISLGNLKVGTYRNVTEKELETLNKMLIEEKKHDQKSQSNQRTGSKTKRGK